MKQHVSWIVALVVGVLIGAFGGGAWGFKYGKEQERAERPALPPPTAQQRARPVEDPKAAYKVLKSDADNSDQCQKVPGVVAAYTESGGTNLVLCLGKNQ